jgi:hypothetical protein
MPKKKGREVGHNYLNTSFTGRSNSALSGSPLFPFVKEDKGTSCALGDVELKNP